MIYFLVMFLYVSVSFSSIISTYFFKLFGAFCFSWGSCFTSKFNSKVRLSNLHFIAAPFHFLNQFQAFAFISASTSSAAPIASLKSSHSCLPLNSVEAIYVQFFRFMGFSLLSASSFNVCPLLICRVRGFLLAAFCFTLQRLALLHRPVVFFKINYFLPQWCGQHGRNVLKTNPQGLFFVDLFLVPEYCHGEAENPKGGGFSAVVEFKKYVGKISVLGGAFKGDAIAKCRASGQKDKAPEGVNLPLFCFSVLKNMPLKFAVKKTGFWGRGVGEMEGESVATHSSAAKPRLTCNTDTQAINPRTFQDLRGLGGFWMFRF